MLIYLCIVQSNFTTRPQDENELYRAFKHRASKRLRDLYQLIKTGQDRNHFWLPPESLEYLQNYWNTEKFKDKSIKAKASRASEKGGPLHTGGSVTIQDTKRQMVHMFSFISYIYFFFVKFVYVTKYFIS